MSVSTEAGAGQALAREGSGAGTVKRRQRLAHTVKSNISKRDPEPRERLVIDFLCEQNGAGLDQLAVALGVDIGVMVRIAYEMKQRQWIATEELVDGAYPWAWVRRPGARYSQIRLEGGKVSRPQPEDVPYRWAAGEVRLRVAAALTGARWVSHAALLRDFRATRGTQVPAGLVEIDGADGLIRRRAIEVGVRKGERDFDPEPDPQRLEETLGELVERYDGVEFFCGPRIHHFVSEQRFEKRFARLRVHLLSGPRRRMEETRNPVMEKLLFQVKRGERAGTAGNARGERRPLVAGEARVVYEIAPSAFPSDGLEEMAKELELELENTPPVQRLWESVGSGVKVYCVETDSGVYRASKSRHGWRIDEVVEEGVFVKEPPYVPAPRSRRVAVYKLSLKQMPPEIPQAIARAEGLQAEPEVIGLWRKSGSGVQVYCAETAEGVYRVGGRSRNDVQATKVDPDKTFVRLPGPPPPVESPTDGEPEKYEIDDALWAKVGPMLATKDPFYQGKVRTSNRAILSGVLHILREELPWRQLRASLGYGGWTGCRRRLRRWQEEGVWDAVQQTLIEELEDGRELAWERLVPQEQTGSGASGSS